MISNLGQTLEKMERKAVEKGMEKGIEKGMKKKAREIAINAIGMGMDNEVIIKLTGLTDEEINEIRKERNH